MTSAVAPVSMTLVTLLAIGAGVALSGGHAPAHGQGGAGPLSAAVLALADTTGSETKSADTADSIPFTVSADKGATETKAAAPKDGAPYARIDAGDRFDLYQRSDGEKKIVASLAANLTASLDFNGAPLAEAVAMIAESYGVPIVFDNQALDAVAITPDVPVTISLRDIPLRSALRLMLKQASSDLTYIVRDDVLLITTRDAAEATHETHIYDLRNVLDMLGAKLPSVAESIPNTVVPESWQDNGTGDGTIATLGDFYLAVNQTQEVHEELAKFLAQIERRGALEKSSHEASTGSRY